MPVSSRSTVSSILLAFYLLVAGGLPIADALIERVGAQAVVDAGQSERERGTPHDESCALCVLLDRVASAQSGQGAALSAEAASGLPAWSAHSEAAFLPPAHVHSARAPPHG